MRPFKTKTYPMKKLILSLAVITAAISANAQAKTSSSKMDQKLRFSLGAELAAPLGDFKKISSVGFGGTLQMDYLVDPALALTLNSGYINFNGKNVSTSFTAGNPPVTTTITTKYPGFGFIPVLGGIKYNFTPQFYGSAQLGVSFSTAKNGGSNFTYAPGVGYKFTDNFDALLKYTGYSVKSGLGGSNSLNTLGLRIAYTF